MSKKVIISGGGTGGHIFPAVSIANALKQKDSGIDILFVGAEGRMEMERVPAEGYPIIGLPVSGFIRKLTLKNITVLLRLYKSLRKARKIISEFKPDAVVGVGGYASGPLVKQAVKNGIPALLQEQNSYAGVTNKLLARQVKKICVAYEGMETYFPKEKIILTGNPVRQNLLQNYNRLKAVKSFGFDPEKKTVLILGGSLGARTINRSVMKSLELISENEVQFIWQTGKIYINEAQKALKETHKNIYVTDFIKDMGMAYAAADVVISRAGAGTISELCLLGKAVILVPSPNVAEDHQTKNAMALVGKDAAVMVKDINAEDQLIARALELSRDEVKLKKLQMQILKLALPDSANLIADEVIKLMK
ncbi:undecaprenyldiphospho-muramoylpentapeptide beta-N-acetylglucosaminyltransferase [Saccharicrinis sp. FJH54]|uniref:undecaprenyldiphospho-muramoylpentapeptide beta-N-acetylglucosaminyltransferase n=1 Tax=Saccharicrinis sp. FJH54 TaxID=3344665 RepID=UPI0035D40DD0